MNLTLKGVLAPAVEMRQRETLVAVVPALARLAFGGLIVLSPFRARFLLDERLSPPIYGDYTSFILFWSDILLLAVLALWGLSLILQPRKIDAGPVLVRWSVIGLAIAVFASIPFSIDPSLSLYGAIRFVVVVGLALYVANEIESLGQIAPAIAVMVVVQAIVGIGQVLDQGSFGLYGLGEYHLDPHVFGVSIVWTNSSPLLLRAYGLTDHPNILGGLLAAAMLLIAGGLKGATWAKSALLSAAFTIGAAALLLTFSRAAILGLCIGGALTLALLAWRREWNDLRLWLGVILSSALLIVALMKPYSPYYSARVNPISQPAGGTEARSLSEREALSKNANEIFIHSPVAGVGMGALTLAMKDRFPDYSHDYQPAPFILLDVAAETGIFGALFYGLLLVTPWGLLWWRRHRLTPELIAVSGALLALSIIGIFDYYTWSLAPGRIWLWLVIGLWAGAYSRSLRTPADA